MGSPLAQSTAANGGRPWNRHDGQAPPAAGADHAEAGVAKARGPGVRRQRHGLAGGDRVGEALGRLELVVLVVGGELAPDPEALEERSRRAGVLAGDQVDRAEDRARARPVRSERFPIGVATT